MQSPVVTLLGHLGSNVASKFHKNRGILKSISQNSPYRGVFSMTCCENRQKIVYFEISQCLNSVLIQFQCKLRAFAEILESTEIGKFFAPEKL